MNRRFWRRLQVRLAPWVVLTTLPLRWLLSDRLQRSQLAVRYFSALSRIDFASVYGALNELLW